VWQNGFCSGLVGVAEVLAMEKRDLDRRALVIAKVLLVCDDLETGRIWSYSQFSVPGAASAGQPRQISVGINSKRYPEQVEVTLYKSVPGGCD
jgi:hypothetical protein